MVDFIYESYPPVSLEELFFCFAPCLIALPIIYLFCRDKTAFWALFGSFFFIFYIIGPFFLVLVIGIGANLFHIFINIDNKDFGTIALITIGIWYTIFLLIVLRWARGKFEENTDNDKGIK